MSIPTNLHPTMLGMATPCNNTLQSMIISVPSLLVNSKTHIFDMRPLSARWNSGRKIGSVWRRPGQRTTCRPPVNLVTETFSLRLVAFVIGVGNIKERYGNDMEVNDIGKFVNTRSSCNKQEL